MCAACSPASCWRPLRAMPPRTDRRTASTAEMGYYPVLLDLAGRRCVMVGGGIIAGRRVDGLVTAGARGTVVSPRLTRTPAALAAGGRTDHQARGERHRRVGRAG